jgi:hypothetical protein
LCFFFSASQCSDKNIFFGEVRSHLRARHNTSNRDVGNGGARVRGAMGQKTWQRKSKARKSPAELQAVTNPVRSWQQCCSRHKKVLAPGS